MALALCSDAVINAPSSFAAVVVTFCKRARAPKFRDALTRTSSASGWDSCVSPTLATFSQKLALMPREVQSCVSPVRWVERERWWT